MQVKRRDMFIPSPGPGTVVWAKSYYTRATGFDMMCTRTSETRSDIFDTYDYSLSSDNGRTWSSWESIPTFAKTRDGVHRTIPVDGFVDPKTDRLVTLILEGTFPNDDPLDGMKRYYLTYEVSTDGGKTCSRRERVMEKGHMAENPFDGVCIGKNCIMTGGWPYLRSRVSGKMLFPMMVTPLGPDGEYCNPGGGYTYTDAVVLMGEWADDLRIEWKLSGRVAGDPSRSTRGMVEPSIAEMQDGRLLMVMRGSNDCKPDLPAHKWFSVSGDGGYSWSQPKPWTYDNGDAFYSPSSISQLLVHSSGRCYWCGNITPDNPHGNSPRYPLVLAEVDQSSLSIIRNSVHIVDDLGPDEDKSLQLSNFHLHEDRESGDIILHLTRFFTSKGFSGDAFAYRISV